MSNSDKAQLAAKAKNYSAKQEARIREFEPLNLSIAKELAEEFGKSHQSIIAKAYNMGVKYEAAKPEPKRVNQETKAELVAKISERLDANLSGLEKATAISLKRLREALPEALPDNG